MILAKKINKVFRSKKVKNGSKFILAQSLIQTLGQWSMS
ncbi:hypothetical protein BH160DRAFT_3956 [Burkholderia sp. H160]|nr:hypothetical protein BH160DRAFT_3956 [Burkholderia sp. H160]